MAVANAPAYVILGRGRWAQKMQPIIAGCAYERLDERLVWLEHGSRRIASIDLSKGSERLIQDFMKKVEAALDGAAFPFDLDFALRVENQLNAFKARGAV